MTPRTPELARELDACLAARHMTPECKGDIAMAIVAAEQARRARPRVGVWAISVVLTTALVVAIVWAGHREPGVVGPPDQVHVAAGPGAEAAVVPHPTSTRLLALGLQVRGQGCQSTHRGRELQLRGPCQLRHRGAGMHMETVTPTTTLRVEADGAHVVAGSVLFAVDKDTARPFPVRIVVSHGVIEVHGTRFFVVQAEHGGTVDLFEGAITFVDPKGKVHDVAVGERFVWGDRPRSNTPQRASRSDTRAPKSARRRVGRPVRLDTQQDSDSTHEPNTKLDLATVLDDVERLRASGRVVQALSRLRALPRAQLTPRMAEIVSYEIGTLLQDRLKDRVQACAHWDRHQTEFGTGPYQGSVRRRRQAMDCG